jgi:hypothetical protein
MKIRLRYPVIINVTLLLICVTWLMVGGSNNSKLPMSSQEFPTPILTALPMLSPSPTLTLTAFPTRTPFPTLTPSPTRMPTPTLPPTLTVDERNAYLNELLETNGGCELPCFWGIIPGETTWEDANRLLSYLGGSVYAIHQGDGTLYQDEFQNWQDDFTIPIEIFVRHGIVDFINIQLVVFQESPRFEQYRQKYSLQSLMSTYGLPSRAWMILTTGEVDPPSTLYVLWLFYDQRGILFWYAGNAAKVDSTYRACPNQLIDEGPVRFIAMLQSSTNDRLLEEISLFAGGIIPIHYSFEEATGLDFEEFYEQVVQGDETACFSTPREIWP